MIDARFHAYGIALDGTASERPRPATSPWPARRLRAAIARGFTTVRDPAGGDHDGGRVDGRITQVINPTTVAVTVTSTSVPATVPDLPFRLGLDVHHDAVAPISGRLRGLPFCGAGAPSGYCGA